MRIGNIEHSYNLLKDESNKIASYILSNKKDENFIGVWGDKSFYSFAAIIGIVKAGKTYVPLNPKFPNNRIKQIIFQAGLKTIISNSDLGFDFGVEELNLDTINRFLGNSYCDVEISNSPQINYFNNPQIYLLFTSGSTGTPKGVSISNNQLVSYLDTVMEFLQVTSNDKLSNTFDLTFDLSIHDIFVTFTQGAMLCVPEENDLISPLNYINKYG
ncbi:MAG: AMP-binding protein, partial [Bacteroidota bacterium]